MAQLKNAPEFNPEDTESERTCREFIDQFITCELNLNNSYVMEFQIPKHTFTCHKGMKNVKQCRFHYPIWPMPETKILSKLSPEERNEKVKINFEKVKNYVCELAKAPRKIPFSQILSELEMSESDYIIAARYSLNYCRVFL